MIEVVGISLGSPLEDAGFTTRFLGKTLRVRRFGTDGSVEQAEKLKCQFKIGLPSTETVLNKFPVECNVLSPY